MANNLNHFYSIIIATHNSATTINECLWSIKKQVFQSFEIIVIDNQSSDKTISIIKSFNFKNIKIIKEKDNGIYDAINKGIKKSKGKVISILHSDDVYYDNKVLYRLNSFFNKFHTEIIYGNLIYVKREDINKKVRVWKPGNCKKNSFFAGWNPPHPSFFVTRKTYFKKGLYKTNIGNAADIELMYRYLIKEKITKKYVDSFFVKMRYGGKSNKDLISILNQNIQILKILKINKDIFKIIYFLISKLFNRTIQFLKA
jgi:glycosyltransferase involved in cell wall biosynthesis